MERLPSQLSRYIQEVLVSNPLGNQPHQDVVIDPVEEFFQVNVDNNAYPDAIYACARSTA
jgi:hypothetical protein